MFHDHSLQQEPLGTVLGYALGNVAVYSCNYEDVPKDKYPNRHAFRHYIDGQYLGYKWQCVEFARRWLWQNKGYIFADVAMAYDIFNLHSVIQVADKQVLPLYSFANGCQRLPEVGAMLIWDEGGMFEETGHVAIVTKVTNDAIYFAEQNVYNHKWPEGQNYSRSYPIKQLDDGGYWFDCEFADSHILGWVMQTDDATHALPTDLLVTSKGNFTLNELSQTQLALDWLDITQADEAAYTKLNGQKLALDKYFARRYLSISATLHKEIKRASNELHAMFMRATDVVLQDDNLLSRFNIPEVIWPKIQQSWNNRFNETIAGRLDLSVGESGIRCFEYNADSASCLMECGKVQAKWLATHQVTNGTSAGAGLFEQLVHAWQKNHTQAWLHILLDDDLEESYHALYMKAAAEKAGLKCKFLKGLQGIHWGDDNQILDPDGDEITKVWKTWAWETALDQLRAHLEQHPEATTQLITRKRNEQPQLVDILLHPDVMVHEPLWTVVTSNKAILPILFELFPDSPYLLESRYQLTEQLKQNGYVKKPIVGRCGANITLHDPAQALIEKTQGKFAAQDDIYQALCTLPQVDDYYVQTNAFIVDGKYAGSCVRVDKSPILSGNSDLPALLVEA